MKTIEYHLSRVWPWLAVAAVALFVVSCGLTVKDVADSTVEAVEQVNGGKLAEDISSGNWIGVALTAAGIVSALVAGLIARKKMKERKNAQ